MLMQISSNIAIIFHCHTVTSLLKPPRCISPTMSCGTCRLPFATTARLIGWFKKWDVLKLDNSKIDSLLKKASGMEDPTHVMIFLSSKWSTDDICDSKASLIEEHMWTVGLLCHGNRCFIAFIKYPKKKKMDHQQHAGYIEDINQQTSSTVW